ncbi:hypothetical protein PNA2_1761 [Pyrococcus sp. NA2]|uniref:thioredoxin fold domain-containing protein n=1 Tax=Pyrococcus sp. (strain NA2) TaxID=342949 RepID=UPI000209AB89|nr:thioredoxin fold domain-containing protein [Pyrococcus sp. NA2]AEC52676.1 hypothetical protein PNA2_1761 [Pyrococcus sp. NA2]
MRKAFTVILLILLTSSLGCLSSNTPTQTKTESWLEGLEKEKFHFYMFGVNTCPHCQKMKRLLPEYYGNGSLTFYELRENKKAYEFYLNFATTLKITGVPLIGIFYDNKLYAIVEGEIDPKVIPRIVKEAMKDNGVILIISSGQFIIPGNETKIIGNLTSWFKLGEQ